MRTILTSCLALALLLTLTFPAHAQTATPAPTWATEQTCAFPWAADHDVAAPFTPGFYRHPYAAVIEVLAPVCLATDYRQNEVGQWVLYCGEPGFAIRRVSGKVGVSDQSRMTKRAVYLDTTTQTWKYADQVIPASTPQGTWGKLPDECYPPSTMVAVEESGAVSLRLK